MRRVVDGANTLYLCSPRGEQRHYEPLFRGALRMVLEEQQRRVDEGASRRVLMVLDEAATVASLDELDQLAATVSGLNVTLVTVVQDFAQLVARWGPRARDHRQQPRHARRARRARRPDRGHVPARARRDERPDTTARAAATAPARHGERRRRGATRVSTSGFGRGGKTDDFVPEGRVDD